LVASSLFAERRSPDEAATATFEIDVVCRCKVESIYKAGYTDVVGNSIREEAVMACSLANIANRTKGFEFVGLYNVHMFLNQTCGGSSDIFFEGTRMLTCAACEKITGLGNSIWTEWTPYPIADIWNRIVVWKLPLLQLLSQFPRPPLGPWVETGVMLHLLGDPIDSVASMFVTLATCQKRALRAKTLCTETGTGPEHPAHTRAWKELAIILVSYDECGTSEKVESFLET
jgi:hypothetical protein